MSGAAQWFFDNAAQQGAALVKGDAAVALALAFLAAACAHPPYPLAPPSPLSPPFQGGFQSVDILWTLKPSLPTEVEYKYGNGREYLTRTREVSSKMLEDLSRGFMQEFPTKLARAGVCVKKNDQSESTLLISVDAVESNCATNGCSVRVKTSINIINKKERGKSWKSTHEARASWPVTEPVAVSSAYYDGIVNQLVKEKVYSSQKC